MASQSRNRRVGTPTAAEPLRKPPIDSGNGRPTGDGQLMHSIGNAARLAGVSRGMLRVWERERLINPGRSPGGHRLYSDDDLRRLREIARLRRMERLNAAAIRRELGVAAEETSPPAPAIDFDLAARLRTLRTAQGRSLANVAAACGLSISFLSAVERGQSNISVGNLFKLADAYGTTVPGLNPDHHSEDRDVLHPQDRPRYVAGHGRVVIEDLITRPGALEAQRIEIRPDGGTEEPYAHPGEEFIYVLSGRLTFWIEETERFQLETGDSLSFRSTRPHRWWNEGETSTTVIWINAPVVESAENSSDRRTSARWRQHALPDRKQKKGG